MQRSFAAGEISPTQYGGDEQQRYQRALSLCRNFVLMRGGGAAGRTGTQFDALVKNSANKTYLYKFVFNEVDTYIIEAGNLYFRFHKLGAPLIVTPAAWNGGTQYQPGNTVVQAGVNYVCILASLNNAPPNATYWYALTGNILEIPTPYLTADIPFLKYVQSGDVVTFTHTGYAPFQLIRSANGWSLVQFSTAPWAAAPINVVATRGTAGTLNPKYVVTAAKASTYEETEASAVATCANSATPTTAVPNVIMFNAVAAAVLYNIYCDASNGNGIYGFIGSTPNTTFNDVGFTPNFALTPTVPVVLFNSSGNYPKCTTYYQQRQLFGGSLNNPEQIEASVTGAFNNFDISNPSESDDAVTFGLAGKQINEVRHMIDIGILIVFTRTGEWSVEGDGNSGALTPTAINAKQRSYWGASEVPPVILGTTALYLQARGTLIRDFRFQQAQSTGIGYYDGRDLTIYAQHLFKGVTIPRMDVALTPDPILWCVRSDGQLLGLTYLPEQPDIWGWAHHDTQNGVFEDVCVIPETMPAVPGSPFVPTSEDAVYVVVNRTISGQTQRSIERFATRNWFDYRLDAIYLDCDLDYNGINAGATTVTLITVTGGWTPNDTIQVTASAPTFDATWVGLGVTVWGPGTSALDADQDVDPSEAGPVPANVARIKITQFVDNQHLKGTLSNVFPGPNVPATLQNTATVLWSKAVSSVSGLTPLAGQAVSILANGIVYTGIVNAAGMLSNVDGNSGLYDVIHVGYPIIQELETLDLDAADKDIRDSEKHIKSVSLIVANSRSFQVGPDDDNLFLYPGQDGTVLTTDIFNANGGALLTQTLETNITTSWDKPGRAHVRNAVPLPLNVLGIILTGEIGG